MTMLTDTEYAVRVVDGDPEIVPVGTETLMREALAEYLVNGQKAEPVVRQVTPWQVDQAAADRVVHEVAQERVIAAGTLVWEEEYACGSFLQALAEIRQYAPEMRTAERARRLDALFEAIHRVERIDDIEPGPDETRDTLAENAEQAVRDAADALIGGAH